MRSARYDAVADFYDASFSDPRDPVLTVLLDLLGPPQGRRVLDLACGHGRVAREVARLGATVIGVDLSAALLDKARAHEDAEPLAIRYVHADAAAVPELDDASVDAVVCNFGLADIDDLDSALATTRRVLRTGGSFVSRSCIPASPARTPSQARGLQIAFTRMRVSGPRTADTRHCGTW
jgi:ubiquinone/menaquinone biosynthesis C-methylase UbiE